MGPCIKIMNLTNHVNQGQNKTMTVPWLKQFSLIIPCNIIFWVLHFFKDYGNWSFVKKGPAVVWESVARLCFVIYIHTTIFLVQTFSFSRLWRRLSSRWIHSLVLHSIYNVLYCTLDVIIFYRCDQIFSYESNFNYTHIEPQVRAPESLSDHQINIGFSQWTRLIC